MLKVYSHMRQEYFSFVTWDRAVFLGTVNCLGTDLDIYITLVVWTDILIVMIYNIYMMDYILDLTFIPQPLMNSIRIL